MRDFRDLKVWQKSHLLTLESYKATKSYPKEELFGLTSQTRRSVASIPANISEGSGRAGGLEFARFFQIAFASACESEYHFLLARDLGYLSEDQHRELESRVVEVKKMLASLLAKVRNEG